MNTEPRIDVHGYYMRMAQLVATRATCLRRTVGCVLTDGRHRVLATGYNGVERGAPHCNQAGLEAVFDTPTGKPRGVGLEYPVKMVTVYPHACHGASRPGIGDLTSCGAVHAEQNALLQCRDVDAIDHIYVTVAPCDPCLKLFVNTNASHLWVGGWYRDNEAQVRARWERPGRTVLLLDLPPPTFFPQVKVPQS